jgi:protein gp37
MTGKEEHTKMPRAIKYHRDEHDYTFNFWRGCHKIHEGCKNCYMFLSWLSRVNGRNPNVVTRNGPATWKQPLAWQRKAKRNHRYYSVFACSSSDFFIKEADVWRSEAWELIKKTPNLIWQLSTKRVDRIADHLPPDWGTGYKNVWLGISLSLKKQLPQLDTLASIPCVLRWTNLSPILEDLTPELGQHLDGIGWISAAGETGCGKVEPRPFDMQWARNLRDLLQERKIPFYFAGPARRARKCPEEIYHVIDGVKYKQVPSLRISKKGEAR